MLISFLLPWIPLLPRFDALISPIFYSLTSNAFILISFSYLSKNKLREKNRVTLILLGLLILDYVSIYLLIPTFRVQQVLAWKITGDYRIMYDLRVISVYGIPGELLSDIFMSVGSIPGSIIMGYLSDFAFNKVSRKYLIAYWIVLNLATTFMVLNIDFCGYAPYQC